ncbi:APC membrane recruitment protein 1 [Rhynchocyon petersi]
METQKDETAQNKGMTTLGSSEAQETVKGTENKAAETNEGPMLEPSGPSRLKKTAMKLFGGKKGICTLPSFFVGGRSKGSGKGSSRKGLSKIKTYDRLSEVICGPKDVASEGIDFTLLLPELPCNLSNSQSANRALETGSRHKMSAPGITDKPEPEKVPLVLKPKKSLKGFFSSIRRHRKGKVTGAEQSEPEVKVLEDARARPQEHVNSAPLHHSEETFQTSSKEDAKYQNASESKISLAPDLSPPVTEKTACKDPGKPTEVCTSKLLKLKPVPEASAPEEPHNAEKGNKVSAREANPPSGPVGDQLSLLFGDVTSLKSFDSLTGCGDIIAEQDMDSMTDSMASGGQRANRDGTKRSSCLVTYQGGGEEMALPDDEEEEDEEELEEEEGEVKEEEEDDDLEYLWASTQIYPKSSLNLGYSPTHSYMLLDPVQSYPGLGHGELLTPQSDQQESAPNSDEGYYDSTTPGFEDDSGETLGLVHRDCLPRDSYSGDALYEFYELDDSLENSPPEDDCLYDLHSYSSEMFDPFLDFEPISSSRPPGAMETEEERLVTIQKQLLYWELQREKLEAQEDQQTHTQEAYIHTRNSLYQEAYTWEAHTRETLAQEACARKVQAHEAPAREAHSMEACAQGASTQEAQARQDKHTMEYQMRSLGPSVMGLMLGASEFSQTSDHGTTSAFPATESSEPDWRDFRPLEKRFEETCSMKDQSTCLMQLFQNNAMFESDMQEAHFRGSPRQAYPTYSPEESEEEKVEKEGNATVSFSQALVEFTSNGNLFSSMSCSSDSDSSFTQNLPELPPMVTFDIADVEGDGEGECEENPEFHNDDDLAASLEAFTMGYYHKRTFNNYHSQFYQGLPWGVSSLPRYLGLSGVHPRPPPAAMALNRRSRSLDTTETLELELSNSHLAQHYIGSDELQAQQENSDEEEEEEGEWSCDSPLSLYTEPPGAYDCPTWAPFPIPVRPGHTWMNTRQMSGLSSQSLYGQAACCVPPVVLPMSLPISEPDPMAPHKSGPQLARPSHLPLPMSLRYNPQPQISHNVRIKPQDVLLPGSEPHCSSSSEVFTPSPFPQAKPVGITHCIPQLPQILSEPPQPQSIRYGTSSLDLSKERPAPGASLSSSYSTVVNESIVE